MRPDLPHPIPRDDPANDDYRQPEADPNIDRRVRRCPECRALNFDGQCDRCGWMPSDHK